MADTDNKGRTLSWWVHFLLSPERMSEWSMALSSRDGDLGL